MSKSDTILRNRRKHGFPNAKIGIKPVTKFFGVNQNKTIGV